MCSQLIKVSPDNFNPNQHCFACLCHSLQWLHACGYYRLNCRQGRAKEIEHLYLMHKYGVTQTKEQNMVQSVSYLTSPANKPLVVFRCVANVWIIFQTRPDQLVGWRNSSETTFTLHFRKALMLCGTHRPIYRCCIIEDLNSSYTSLSTPNSQWTKESWGHAPPTGHCWIEL